MNVAGNGSSLDVERRAAPVNSPAASARLYVVAACAFLAGVGCGACTPIPARSPSGDASAESHAVDEADDLFAYYSDARRLEIGERVPDIELRDRSGRALTFADFRGSVVVLAFVGASESNDNDTEMLERLAEFGNVVGPALASKVHLLTLVLGATSGSPALSRAQIASPPGGVPWTFIGAGPRDAALLAAAFGVVLWQKADGSIGHTFNTVIIDPGGHLVDNFPGLDTWSPRDVVAAASLAAAH